MFGLQIYFEFDPEIY